MQLKHHPSLTVEKWRTFPFFRRILMIGNEINRAQHWIEQGDPAEVNRSYERALELLDLTLATADRAGQRKELLRFRELLASAYLAAKKESKINQDLFGVLLSFDPGSYAVLPVI